MVLVQTLPIPGLPHPRHTLHLTPRSQATQPHLRAPRDHLRTPHGQATADYQYPLVVEQGQLDQPQAAQALHLQGRYTNHDISFV